jgi:low affinity Fe/Cu permease
MKAIREFFSRFSRNVALMVAHPVAFILAVLVVVVWAALGPWLHYSDQWQLVINTGTTILTFLMVFLLQNTQNRDSRAIQVKLDELLRAVDGARNELIDLEDISEEELARYSKEFHELHLQYARELECRGQRRRAKSPVTPAASPPANGSVIVPPRPMTSRQQKSGEH